MGILDFLFGKSGGKDASKPAAVAAGDAAPAEEYPSYEEVMREYRERERERERLIAEGEAMRRRKMSEMGVDVDAFTEDLVRSDALALFGRFFPSALRIGADPGDCAVSIGFENPTKAGKVPKNVAHARFLCEAPVSSGLVRELVADLKYMRDGDVNMADLSARSQDLSVEVSVRRADGSFSITKVSTYDVARGVYDVIWSAGDPGDPADAAARVLSGM